MSGRLTPDGHGGFDVIGEVGKRLVPDGMGGFHVLEDFSTSAAEGLTTLLIPFMVIAVVVGVPLFVTFIVIAGIIMALTQSMLGRPLTPDEANAIAVQTAIVTAIFWVIIVIFITSRRNKK